MHVFWDDPDPTDDERVVADDEPGLEDLRALVAESVAGMGEKFPDVDARVVLVRGHRDRELIKASATMDLLVVGSRQRGAINDFVHGAISPTIVEHAHCDVAVVPALATHG
jgi:nucleotide-binding universal stress UspA family protein